MSADPEKLSRSGHRILAVLLGRSEHITFIGDLEEIHAGIIREKGAFRAGLWYWGQICLSIPHYLYHLIYWSGIMIKNYFVTSMRNIKNHRMFSMINILGLSIGLAASFLAVFYIRDEMAYDRYNEKARRISRVKAFLHREGQDINIIGAGYPVGPALVEGFSEVEDAVRFRQSDSIRVTAIEKSFRESNVVFSESSFFNVFTAPILRGNPENILSAPRTLAISRKAAEKYFGELDVLGKTLSIDGEPGWTVTGVFQDIPRTSHFHFDMILSLSSLEIEKNPMEASWISFNFPTYVLMRDEVSTAELEGKLPSLLDAHMASEVKQFMGISLDEFLSRSGMRMSFGLQPLLDIHLHSHTGIGEFEANSDIKYIRLFAAVSLFILILAVINFINLATARSSGRAKEVGVRKVLGSLRRNLMGQFLIESMILSLIAFVTAVLLIGLVMPFFNRMTGKSMVLESLILPDIMLPAVGLVLLIGFLAGVYPAVFLSAYRPSTILRGTFKLSVHGGALRRVLVIFQFCVSVVMIFGTLVVFNQLRYIQNTPVGFNKEQVLILENTQLLGDRADMLKEKMLSYPQVVNASLSGFLPIPSARMRIPVARVDDADPQSAPPIGVWLVDHDYIDTLEIKIASGRKFSRELESDSGALLLNQAAVRFFGFEQPLGESLLIVDSSPEESLFRQSAYSVIGVIEDFHFESLRESIKPMVMSLGKSRSRLCMRIQREDVAGTIETLRKEWTALAPGEPFEYSFLDERFNRMYDSELRVGRIFGAFSGLAVFIGCLGLFGLATFSAAKRTKEIGIHKVFGATAADVVRILVREYLLLVGIANLIALPIGYWLMSGWLRQFAYNVGVGWVGFAVTTGLTILVALVTVGFQSTKAAAANPAQILKYE